MSGRLYLEQLRVRRWLIVIGRGIHHACVWRSSITWLESLIFTAFNDAGEGKVRQDREGTREDRRREEIEWEE